MEKTIRQAHFRRFGFVLLGYLTLAGLVYFFFGHAFLTKMYEKGLIGFLNIYLHPLEVKIPLQYYFIKGDILFVLANVLICFLSFLIFLLIRSPREALLLLATLLILFLSAETAHLLTKDQHDELFQYDSELGWTFVPGKKARLVEPGVHNAVQINPQGFRDQDFGPEDFKKKRILALGDSFVSNISIPDKEVFTERMEQQWPNVSVMNLGVNGYGQVQEYLLLKKKLKEYRPDAVFVMIYLRNDFLDNPGYRWSYGIHSPTTTLVNDHELKITPPEPYEKPPGSFWDDLWTVQTYFEIRQAISMHALKESGALNVPLPVTPPEFYLGSQEPHDEEFSLTSKNPPQFVRRLFRIMKIMILKISDLCEEEKTPVFFVLAPSFMQVNDALWEKTVREFHRSVDQYQLSLPNDILMKFAEEHQLSMLDLLPRMKAETKKGLQLYNPHEIHWTTEGNRVAAEEILQYVRAHKRFAEALGV